MIGYFPAQKATFDWLLALEYGSIHKTMDSIDQKSVLTQYDYDQEEWYTFC